MSPRLATITFAITAFHVTAAALLLASTSQPRYDPDYTYLVILQQEDNLQVVVPFRTQAECMNISGPAHGTCLQGRAAESLFSEGGPSHPTQTARRG